jgi:hypothetical protein
MNNFHTRIFGVEDDEVEECSDDVGGGEIRSGKDKSGVGVGVLEEEEDEHDDASDNDDEEDEVGHVPDPAPLTAHKSPKPVESSLLKSITSSALVKSIAVWS